MLKIDKSKLRKKGFTLIEVLAAVVISSISLLAMIKISVEATKQSLKNQAADRATQIYSLTSQMLLDLKTPPLLASSPFCRTDATPYDQIFLGWDSTNSKITLNRNDPAAAGIGTQTTKNSTEALKSTSETTTPYDITFVQEDNHIMDPKDKEAGFYRAIGFQYSALYKTLNVRIIIYWNMYGVDNYYVNYNIFNVDECLS